MEPDKWMEKFQADSRTYFQNIGEVVVYWNACEGHLRDMVIWLAGGRTAANLALTAHMSGKALIDALPTMTSELTPQVRAHFEHYTKAIDILREHRNYYAHGISVVGIGLDSIDATDYAMQITGKIKLKLHHQKVEISALAELKQILFHYQIYGFNLLCRTFPGFRNYPPVPDGTPWPERLPLPDKLKKGPPVLLGAYPPPGSLPG